MKTKIHALIPQDYPDLLSYWEMIPQDKKNNNRFFIFIVGVRKYEKLFMKICQTNGLDPETERKRKSDIFFKSHKIISTGRIGT